MSSEYNDKYMNKQELLTRVHKHFLTNKICTFFFDRQAVYEGCAITIKVFLELVALAK